MTRKASRMPSDNPMHTSKAEGRAAQSHARSRPIVSQQFRRNYPFGLMLQQAAAWKRISSYVAQAELKSFAQSSQAK